MHLLPHSPEIGFEQSEPLPLLLLCASIGHGFAQLLKNSFDFGQPFFRSHGLMILDAGEAVNVL